MGSTKIIAMHEADMPALVVPDTNILLQDRDLKSTLATMCGKRPKTVQLAVPEVVILEFANQVRKQAVDAAAKVHQGLKDHKKATGEDLSSGLKPAQAYADQAEARIRARLVELKALEVPIPDVLHRQLLARDLAGRPPFRESGKGYRDALIWESVLGLAREGHQVALVSNDGDFGKDVLEEELASEARAIEGHGGVTRFKEAHECIEAFVKPRLANAEKGTGSLTVRALNASADFRKQLQGLILRRLQEMHPSFLDDDWGGKLPEEWVAAGIVEIQAPSQCMFVSLTRLLNGGLLAEGTFAVNVIAVREVAMATKPKPDEWMNDYALISLEGHWQGTVDEKRETLTAMDVGLLSLVKFSDDEDLQGELRHWEGQI